MDGDGENSYVRREAGLETKDIGTASLNYAVAKAPLQEWGPIFMTSLCDINMN